MTNYLILRSWRFKERRARSSSFSEEISGVFQVRPPGRSSAVWTCPGRHRVARKDTQRVTVCTSAPVFLSEWRWLIKIGALSPAYPNARMFPFPYAHTRMTRAPAAHLYTRDTVTDARASARERRAGGRRATACLNVYLAARNTLASHVRIEIMSSKKSIVS